MLITTDCGLEKVCPHIDTIDGDDQVVRVTGWRPGDAREPAHESAVDIPIALIPGAAARILPDLAGFEAHLAGVRVEPGDQLRIQTLDHYGSPADQPIVRRYLSGGPAPTEADAPDWVTYLDDEAAAAHTYRNLHIVDTSHGLSDYLRATCEWIYPLNARHGQEVRILDLAHAPALAPMTHLGDFWTLERAHVVLCRYDTEGNPTGWIVVDDAGKHGYLVAAELAWNLAQPLADWWTSHPRHHRAAASAT